MIAPLHEDGSSEKSTDLQEGSLWRHFKGGVYRILHLARIEATLETVVVYHSLSSDDVWVRPLEVWLEEVRPGVPRFVPVEELPPE